jgi:hypothetical protein
MEVTLAVKSRHRLAEALPILSLRLFWYIGNS